ncbi:HAD domain-containing protein [Peterkaempfera griseoplana]|uniref:HAD domain-containing protein n=1 Tax=Peterkaempfera griseoplana TaxID=66896 RepID=UPI0006E19DE5|nr:HAD domain-containing protein [Peterkaempfera griseoplana]
MTSSGRRPLLFLDVDGPLIPFGATPLQLPGGYATYPAEPGSPGSGANPLLDRLDPTLGSRLVTLGCELVWATSWMEEANEFVGPRIGLPQLPVVVWPESPEEDERDGLHWKTRGLLDWAAGRPFVWVDDEISDADRAWVAAHHPGAVLLHRADAATGLTGADFAAVAAWLRTLPLTSS